MLQARAKLSDNKVNGTRRRDRERDDQQVAHAKKLYFCEVLSGTFHGPDGISKLVENCETGVSEETGRGTEERNQKLQSNCLDIGDVKVVCILYHLVLGEGKGACKMERPTCCRNGWNKLPTLVSVGDEFAAQTGHGKKKSIP